MVTSGNAHYHLTRGRITHHYYYIGGARRGRCLWVEIGTILAHVKILKFYRINRAIGTAVVADHGSLVTTNRQLDCDIHRVVCC